MGFLSCKSCFILYIIKITLPPLALPLLVNEINFKKGLELKNLKRINFFQKKKINKKILYLNSFFYLFHPCPILLVLQSATFIKIEKGKKDFPLDFHHKCCWVVFFFLLRLLSTFKMQTEGIFFLIFFSFTAGKIFRSLFLLLCVFSHGLGRYFKIDVRYDIKIITIRIMWK